MTSIKELNHEDVERFFRYLAPHIAENGQQGDALYFPLSKEQSVLSPELSSRFKEGLSKSFGEVGWRKLWVAMDAHNEILGHIDLRSNNQLNASHRVVLGMGVQRDFRKSGIGQMLLEFVIDFCIKHPGIAWLDLEVMTNNDPAVRLYERMNFEKLSTTKDMFRIDGNSYDYTAMTLNVER